MKTVRVRIAVCVSIYGEWKAVGASHTSKDRMIEDASEHVGQPNSIVWVEADIPLPKLPTIEGEVK